jgi:acetate kinase
MKIAVLNSGSSSIKYQVFDMRGPGAIVAGAVEGIGETAGRVVHRLRTNGSDETQADEPVVVSDHHAGFELVRAYLAASGVVARPGDLDGIGHRVVHGGERFREPTRITPEVIDGIRAQTALAPLHNPANLIGIEAALARLPDTPQVAVFDTAFHQTMPPVAYLYAVPDTLYGQHRVRRYGFHGTSNRFVVRAAADYLGLRPGAFNAIVLHLGNGASVTAIRGGRSIDTSMGLTPLEGLVMGTRSGDVDPALHRYLVDNADMSIDQIDELLNRQSGLKGLCGDNDMRQVEARAAAGDDRARLAFDIFCYRAKKYLGAYAAVLGRVDAIVFTAGIGEHSPAVRESICSGLESLGISIDPGRNTRPGSLPAAIHSPASRMSVLVVGTNEELEIALQTRACLRR